MRRPDGYQTDHVSPHREDRRENLPMHRTDPKPTRLIHVFGFSFHRIRVPPKSLSLFKVHTMLLPVRDLFDHFYDYLLVNYRSEYIYKNAIRASRLY